MADLATTAPLRTGVPARSRPRRLPSERPDAPGAAPLLAIVAALGLLMIAFGNNAARDGAHSAQPLFWGGLVIIYGPIALRLLSVSASRLERLCLVVLMGIALFLVKVLYSPTFYPPFDELATWRQTHELLITGHLFVDNPIAAGYPAFPGLETVTGALSLLTGFNIFHAGVVVIGFARALLMLALFLFLERVTGSSRGAGIGVAIYACNPSFLYFDAQFGHESLALLLGAALLLVAIAWSESTWREARLAAGLLGAMIVLVGGLTVTHHMTSYAISAFLIGWVALTARENKGISINLGLRASLARTGWSSTTAAIGRGPLLPALLMSSAAALWFIFVAGSDTTEELGGVLTDAANSVWRLIFGGSGPKTLFQGSSETNSTAARVLAFASVIPVLALIPFGFLKAWRTQRPNPLWRALALVAVLYPITLGLRLTLSGTETSQRASEFVFVGLGFLAALVVGSWRLPRSRARRLLVTSALAGLATLMFCGAFIVSELPATRQPGPFLVGGDARSVSAPGLEAARFAAANLPPDSRLISDRANGTLMGSYGGLNPVLGSIDGIPVAHVLFGPRIDRADRIVIREDEIDYVLVDQRLTRELPILGFYIEPDEPHAFNRVRPLPQAAIDKFTLAKGFNRIYANGPIAIYSTSRLRPE
jgi:hypothetical protein